MKYLEKDDKSEYNNTKRNLKEMIKFINDAMMKYGVRKLFDRLNNKIKINICIE